jgi:serine/threonine-protein kinase
MAGEFVSQLQPGMKVGKYQIVALVATGGMALVYKAYDKALDRYVAIKQIASNLAADPKFVERFRREAQILAKLGQGQQNVVAVFELVEEQGGLFMIMEFVEGASLQKLMDRGAAPLQTGLGILLKVTLGLKAIHAEGIVHRDLKPDNIMIQQSGGVKIADFGLVGRSGGRTSLPMGTTQYMAPETFTGGTVDARADIYSLGFIAYQMFAGPDKFREVFSDILADPQSASIRWMHWHGNPQLKAPPLREIQPGVPPLVARIVERMMEKDPARRFASADQILKWLRQILMMNMQGKSLTEQDSAKLEQEVDAEVEGAVTPAAGQGGAVAVRRAGGKPAVINEAAKTAPLPKRRWGWQEYAKYGGIAAGVLIALLITLHIISSSKAEHRAADASAMLGSGLKFYNSEQYNDAIKKFDEVEHQFPDLAAAQSAQYWKLMSDAQIKSKSQNWDAAYKFLHEAKSFLREASEKRAAWATADMNRKSQDLEDSITNLKTRKQYLDEADDAITEGKYDEAKEKYKSILSQNLALASDDIPAKIKKVEGMKAKAEAGRIVTQAEDQVRAKKYEDARQLYISAATVLKNASLDDSGPAAGVNRVGHIEEYLRKAADADKEYEAKNWAVAADDYDQALAVPLDKEDKVALNVPSAAQKGKTAKSKAKELEADARKAGGDVEGAKTLYAEAVKIDSSNQSAAQQLAALESKSTYDKYLAEAYKAWNDGAGDYDKAKELLNSSLAIQADEATKAKVQALLNDWTQVYYMKEGQKALEAKDFAKARDLYDQARAANPTNKDRVRTIAQKIQSIDTEEPYAKAFGKAVEAFKRNDYVEARRQAKEAAKYINKSEVKELLQSVEYQDQRDKGLEAMKAGNYSEALGFFHLAKNARDTDEIKGDISAAEAKLGGAH